MTEVKLPSAQQIAAMRVKDMPVETLEQRIAKAVRFNVETQHARRELANREWTL